MRVTVIGLGGVGGYFGARLAQGGCDVGFVARGEQLREVLGEQAVVGGLCYIGSKILRPGVIQHTGTIQKMIFGELDGRPSARTEALLAAGKRGGIEAAISPDIRRAIWEKCVFITGVSAATTAMRSPIGPIRSDPRTRAFLLDLMREVAAVGRALGVNLEEGLAESKLAFCDSLPAEMTSSMHHDLQQGRRLEVPWLNGRIVELGKSLGVPTPLNRAVSDILALATYKANTSPASS